mmetsp:Transcript_4753/g.7170  ORF Transcript_4753/g.7170 Transcript_4753/m.7170 type:complete len:137 (+) Transcript_4753:905-1315(+)
MDEAIRKDYLLKFRKEVDFHHKIGFKFERAYRMSRKHPEKKQELNGEIIEIITEHSDYIQHDPMSMFYMLYFCIYFNNKDLVSFLRALIFKVGKVRDQHVNEKINMLLEMIEYHGLDSLRSPTVNISSRIYHMVLY